MDKANLAALLADFDLVAGLDRVARNVDPLAVHEDVIVAHQLAPLSSRGGQAGTQHEVVQPAFEQAEHRLASSALHGRSERVVAAELLLQQTVDAARLLLLAQAQPVLAHLEATL